MRLKDLLLENDVKQEIINSLMDMISAYRQKKHLKVPINGHNGVIQYLHNIGYDVTFTELQPILAGDEFKNVVDRSTPEEIIIKSNSPEKAIHPSKEQKSKEHVAKQATKAANKAVKNGDKV